MLRKRIAKSILCLLLSAAVCLGIAAGTDVSLEAEAAASITVTSAQIQGTNVVVTANVPRTPAAADGILHLYAQEMYESGTAGVEVAQATAAAGTATFVFPLGKNTAASNLFKKFTVVTVSGGQLVQSSNACYITNPEGCAVVAAPRRDSGKKGILQESRLLSGNLNDLTAMGINQVTYNLRVGDAMKSGDIRYTYNGETYYFHGPTIRSYDKLVPQINSKGVSVTIILLNNWAGDPNTIHPLARDGVGLGPNYYAYNVAEPAGLKKLEAFAAFLGERYSGSHGTVDNWIVGNEVNARHEWNYITPGVGVAGAAAEYSKALRVFYNGIKSYNSNARVYAGVDHEWGRSDNVALHYGAKEFLVNMNGYISAEGNFAYGIAHHPYNYDLRRPMVWEPTAYVNHTQNSIYVTMANIDVLTDFFCQPAYLCPDGSVRSILLSEVSYNSHPAFGGSEPIQATSMVYGYLQAMNNQHIDGFFPRECDAFEEVAQGMAFGVMNADFSHKLAYNWYANALSPDILATASAIIGADINSLMVVR